MEALEDAINDFGEDALIVLTNGQRYGAGFGSIATNGNRLVFVASDEDEEEDYL